MKAWSNKYSPIIRSQKNNKFSATTVIIETHVSAKRYYIYSKKIIKKTTIRVN